MIITPRARGHRGRSSFLAASALLAATLSAPSAFAGPAARAVPAYSWAGDGLLPFPSDVYTVADPTAATGLRLALPEGLWTNDILQAAPFDARPVLSRLADLDGFSPAVPLLLAIPAAIDPASVPSGPASAGPDSPIFLIDLETHQRLPYRVHMATRKDDEAQTTLVLLHPWDRLKNGRKYAVVVRNCLKDTEGKPVQPRPGFREALAGLALPARPLEPWQMHLKTLGDRLREEGFEADQLAMAFDFTVASKERYAARLQSLDAVIQEKAARTPYKVSKIRIRRVPFKDAREAGIKATGTFEALQFIDDRGRLLEAPVTQEVPFLLEMPASCPEGGCPVAIFGHGLGATKETMFQVADEFAARGIATVGVAAPWHTNYLQPFKVLMGSRRNIDLLHGLFLSHVMRNVQLVELIRQDLAGRDLRSDRETRDPDSVKRTLRGDRIFYIGQSMGGICGVATSALAPEIKSTLLDVAGGSSVDMLYDSWVVRTMRLPMLGFDGMDTVQTSRLAPLAMYLFDDMDPLGFAPMLTRDPFPGESPRLVTQQAGVGDGLVPNWTSEKLARALGLPIVRTPDDAVSQAPSSPGVGLRYFRNTGNFFLAHLELMRTHGSSSAAEYFAWSLQQLETAAAQTPGLETHSGTYTAAGRQ